MGDAEQPRETSEQLLRRYHLNICRALIEYMEAGNALRVRGDREGNKLVVTFVVDDADSFHPHLETLNLDVDEPEE